ncbi:MAG: glycosyltransferase [Bacteroidales bacterium]|nr:glycosyltransferase [Bacteroidales bacterium]
MRKFLANIGRAASEVSLPLWIPFLRASLFPPLSGDSGGVIVSLTTFPARIGKLWVVLQSLFRQTVRPDKIVVVLTEDEFPGGVSSLPSSLDPFLDLGVEVVFRPYNLKCHNKYEYSLRTFPEAVVITVDDDCYYRSDTIERLLTLHDKYPGSVCCDIAAVIDPDHFFDYSCWRKSSSASAPGHLNVALGFAGVLYPPGLPVERFCDKDLAMGMAPTADDLWLKAVEIDCGVKVACGDFFPKPVTIKSSQKISLRKVNKGSAHRNDSQWMALDDHFHLRDKIWY